MGVTVADTCVAPFAIDLGLADQIGGPSGGLMFALGIIDKVGSVDLTKGQSIAGTGTIDQDGKVGAIGGITHKMLAAHDAGASIFLVPADNCDEARSAHEDGLQLIKVDTLTTAIDALHTVSAGGEAPHC